MIRRTWKLRRTGSSASRWVSSKYSLPLSLHCFCMCVCVSIVPDIIPLSRCPVAMRVLNQNWKSTRKDTRFGSIWAGEHWIRITAGDNWPSRRNSQWVSRTNGFYLYWRMTEKDSEMDKLRNWMWQFCWYTGRHPPKPIVDLQGANISQVGASLDPHRPAASAILCVIIASYLRAIRWYCPFPQVQLRPWYHHT